jgi:hypothetical protein
MRHMSNFDLDRRSLSKSRKHKAWSLLWAKSIVASLLLQLLCMKMTTTKTTIPHPTYTIGDLGSSWHMMQLKNLYTATKEAMRPVEEITVECLGNLLTLSPYLLISSIDISINSPINPSKGCHGLKETIQRKINC